MACNWVLRNGLKIQWQIESSSWDTKKTINFPISFTQVPSVTISANARSDSAGNYTSYIISVTNANVTIRPYASKIAVIAIGY